MLSAYRSAIFTLRCWINYKSSVHILCFLCLRLFKINCFVPQTELSVFWSFINQWINIKCLYCPSDRWLLCDALNTKLTGSEYLIYIRFNSSSLRKMRLSLVLSFTAPIVLILYNLQLCSVAPWWNRRIKNISRLDYFWCVCVSYQNSCDRARIRACSVCPWKYSKTLKSLADVTDIIK